MVDTDSKQDAIRTSAVAETRKRINGESSG